VSTAALEGIAAITTSSVAMSDIWSQRAYRYGSMFSSPLFIVYAKTIISFEEKSNRRRRANTALRLLS
jgi:hypothetical protein